MSTIKRYDVFSPGVNSWVECEEEINGEWVKYDDHAAELAALRAELASASERADKLQAFKDYVHQRLDDAGIPSDPDSPHKAAGCRIGGRLDVVLARVEVAERDASGIPHNAVCFYKDGNAWCCVFGDFVNLQESPAGFGDSFDTALTNLKENASG